MYPFSTTNSENKSNPINDDLEETLNSSEAIQGDEAVISAINELNNLRNEET